MYEVLTVVIVQEEETTGVQVGGPNLQEDHDQYYYGRVCPKYLSGVHVVGSSEST